jgi:drug/metabolite transporter (DMT)-like permease
MARRALETNIDNFSASNSRYNFDFIAPRAAAAGAFVCVGLSVVATRFAVVHSDALTIAFIRNGMAFVLLFPFLNRGAKSDSRVASRDLLWMGVLGLSSFAAMPLLFTAALRYAPATHGALALPAATPILTLSLAVTLGREHWTKNKLGGVGFAALGVAIALSEADWSAASSDTTWFGDLLMLFAAGTIAVYNVLSRPFLNKYGPLKLLSVALSVGTGALLLLVVLRALYEGPALPRFEPIEWVAIGVVGITSALSNWLWSWSLSKITPTAVAVFIALNPLVALAGAVVLLHEKATVSLGIGLIFVLAGIALVNRPDRPKQELKPS